MRKCRKRQRGKKAREEKKRKKESGSKKRGKRCGKVICLDLERDQYSSVTLFSDSARGRSVSPMSQEIWSTLLLTTSWPHQLKSRTLEGLSDEFDLRSQAFCHTLEHDMNGILLDPGNVCCGANVISSSYKILVISQKQAKKRHPSQQQKVRNETTIFWFLRTFNSFSSRVSF